MCAQLHLMLIASHSACARVWPQVRDELLRGMLNADLIGFHIFEACAPAPSRAARKRCRSVVDTLDSTPSSALAVGCIDVDGDERIFFSENSFYDGANGGAARAAARPVCPWAGRPPRCVRREGSATFERCWSQRASPVLLSSGA